MLVLQEAYLQNRRHFNTPCSAVADMRWSHENRVPYKHHLGDNLNPFAPQKMIPETFRNKRNMGNPGNCKTLKLPVTYIVGYWAM